jgi:hypothetical protein
LIFVLSSFSGIVLPVIRDSLFLIFRERR